MADKLAALKSARGVPARPSEDNPDVDVQGHLLFEVCSEIGRQGTFSTSICFVYLWRLCQIKELTSSVTVGGVHTVLKTKAPVTTREYGDRYTLVGRLDRETVSCCPPTQTQHGRD